MVKDEKLLLSANIVLTARLLVKSINNHFANAGVNITMEQLEILFHIASNSEKQIIQTEVANCMVKNKSAIVKSIDILERKNYVRRLSLSDDRRKNVLEITPSGHKVIKEASKIFNSIKLKYLEQLESNDVELCNKVLNKIKKSIDSND